MSQDILLQAMVYFTAAIVCVPLAKRLGLSSVLGYILAGVLIGPFLLGFIGNESHDIMHFAEFGVVMMLFLIGLELEPAKFWRMRTLILGMGTLQIGLTTLLLTGGGLLLGMSWPMALTASLALALSSTAIVLQTLKEKNQMNTTSGQSSFSVLLFQDIAVIPMLAVLPLLGPAVAAATGHDSSHSASLIAHLPSWAKTLAVLGSVGLIALVGQYLIVPALRLVSKTHLRELFAAASLLIVVAIAYLMGLVGLSPALGAFLGGVVLANSEFRHELESDLEPFKGLLLGLFFMGVGASINFDLVMETPGLILALVGGIMAIKATVLAVTGRIFKLGKEDNLTFALGLAQVGEFAFVLLSFAHQLHIMDSIWMGRLMAVTALTMAISPLLSMLNERVLLPRLGPAAAPNQGEMDRIDENNTIILVGFSDFGSTLGRFLRANGIEATILDHDAERVALLRRMGFKVYYGDATRIDLLESAGAHTAKILISAIDVPETNQKLVETIHKHFPKLELMIRARNRFDAYELMELGVTQVYRDPLESSVRIGVEALRKLGFRNYTLTRIAQNFIQADESMFRKLATESHNITQYVSRARAEIEAQEALLANERQKARRIHDHAWDSEPLRNASPEQEG
jgi:CPA2 family monovalent cation:H+ antiporter-2